MQQIFAFQVGKAAVADQPLLTQFSELKEAIDHDIQTAAPEWPLQQMNQVDLAILRTILLEHQRKKTPVKVLIDEAVILAKEFGTDSSPKLVNGVLGKILIDSR